MIGRSGGVAPLLLARENGSFKIGKNDGAVPSNDGQHSRKALMSVAHRGTGRQTSTHSGELRPQAGENSGE